MVEPGPIVIVLRDGARATLRPADARDARHLERLLGRVPAEARLWLVTGVDDEAVLGAGGFVAHPREALADTLVAVEAGQLGRGIGTLLLEHVLEEARTVGIDTLVATASADDAALEVLRNSGVLLREEQEGDRVRIELSTDRDEHDDPRWQERERARTAASLLPVFCPRSVAVIGASPSPAGIGRQVFDRLVQGGFEGPVYPVHPTARVVASVRAYPTIADVPDRVDLAVIAVPAPAVPGVVEECAAAGVRAVVVVSAGFAEVGEEGRQRQDELLRVVRSHGMRMVGPNCLGVLNTHPAVRLNATFGRPLPPPGRVGMSSQSGAMGLVIVDYASQLGLGLSTFASVGNKADISGNDLLEYWERDPETGVIALYLESFGNPRRFSRIARRVSRTKPILAVKSGRSTAGARAAQSHTAALASSDVAVDALFRQAGVIRLDTLDELFDVAGALSHQPLPSGNRVAILTNAGGPGILCADACEAAGLELPPLAEPTLEVLRAVLPPTAGIGNPVDMIAAATPDQYELVTAHVLQDPGIDAVIVLNVTIGGRRAEAFGSAIRRGMDGASRAGGVSKPVLACFMSPGQPPTLDDTLDGLEVGTIPVYRFPEAPARALGRMWQHQAWRERPPGRVPSLDHVDAEAARSAVAAARAAGRRWLSADENARLLAAAGIAMPRFRVVRDGDAAVAAAEELGPVAVKAIAPDLVHKTDVGGVALDLRDSAAVRDACERMAAGVDGIEGFFVQEMVGPGVEVIVGLTSDRTFGPLVAFGLGGTAVEVLQDVAFRITPLTDVDAQELVRSIRGFPLLTGYRGRPPTDVAALEDLLLRISWLARVVPELGEMDLNPVRLYEAGLAVVDVRTAVTA